MDKPFIEKEPNRLNRCVARTQNIGEAERVCEQYELQGMDAKIIRKKQGVLSIYEVWVSGEGSKTIGNIRQI